MGTTEPGTKWSRLGWFALIWAVSVAAMIAVSLALRAWLV
jgi:hypothetical protein